MDIERDLESRIGLRAGDVIVRIDRLLVESAEQAAEILRRVTGNFTVYIERNGEVIARRLRGTRG